MKKTLACLGLFMAVAVMAQDKQAIKYAKTITEGDLKAHLSILASDEYEGRETGKKGQKMAAKYISDKFKEFGFEGPVDGSYYQTFDLTESSLTTNYFRKGDEKMIGFEDFIYYSRAETAGEEYVKFVMADDDDSMMDKYKGAYVAYKVEKLGGMNDRIEKAMEAGAKGAMMVITNEDEFGSVMGRYGPYLKRPSLGLKSRDNESDKMIIAGTKLASWIYDKDFGEIKPGEMATIIFNADYLDKPVSTENVLGFLKGSEKPDEIVIITSHYDHVGIIGGEIHNGADDDGSGTVSVLEIAQAFSLAKAKKKGPKRSILFMTVTGEEKGLLGSQYYTDFDPIFPLENTVTNLNIDMVGRIDDAHKDKRNYAYLIGSDKLSQELHELSENVRDTYMKDFEFDYTYNDENDPNRFYYRSDHYNFAKNNVPIIFYFNGTHPDYHQPSDTVEKIAFDIMANRAKVIFHTAWEIANRDGRITADKLEEK